MTHQEKSNLKHCLTREEVMRVIVLLSSIDRSAFIPKQILIWIMEITIKTTKSLVSDSDDGR